MDLGFLYQVRAGQDLHFGPPQTFQISKGRHPPKTSTKRNGQFHPGARTKKTCTKEVEKNSKTTHPPGSVPQAINIPQILWRQETQAKLTKPEWGTDLGKGTFSVHVEKLEIGGSEGEQRQAMNVPPDLTQVERIKVHLSWVRYARLQLQGLRPCVRLKGFFPPPLYLPCTNNYSLEKHPSWNFPHNYKP